MRIKRSAHSGSSCSLPRVEPPTTWHAENANILERAVHTVAEQAVAAIRLDVGAGANLDLTGRGQRWTSQMSPKMSRSAAIKMPDPASTPRRVSRLWCCVSF